MSAPDELKQVAEQIRTTDQVHRITPRELIRFYGAQRRGQWISSQIRADLKSLDLNTLPNFETAYIDEEIKIISTSGDTKEEGSGPIEPTIEFVSGGSVSDPVARIRMLDAANRIPVSIKRDAPVTTAMTLMLINDFSQLPVLANERDVNGMISWRSIGRAQALGRPCEFVRECMEEAKEIRNDAPFLEAMELLAKHDAILVRERDRRVVGLVTTSDLSLEFKSLAEPFLLIGEIENHLRRLIDGKFAREAIESAKNTADPERQISDVADLNFGEYIHLLEVRENWMTLSLELDRVQFCSQLEKVRCIRNDVMHFSPDGTSEEHLEMLRDFVKFLQHL